MSERVLVTGAGIGGSNNLIRSLRAGDPSIEIIGCHDDRFLLKKSLADRVYLIPPLGDPRGRRALCRIVDTEKIDLVIPTSEPDVAALSRLRSTLGDRVLLPRRSLIDLCQDKYRLNALLRANRIPVPATVPVGRLTDLGRVFQQVAVDARAWCRVRGGAGSLGAIAVDSPEQARHWIRYWQDMRKVPPRAFILSEYLPGRDFGCQSLWKDGTLVVIKTYERLSYLVAGSQPTQVSSVAALAKTVFEPRIVDICTTAVRTLDPKASGVFSIDLRENARGIPCITEINAGRFSSATPIFDLTGKYNMAVTYVRLALGAPVEVREAYDIVEDHYMLRDLDTPPRIVHADDFFEDVHEASPTPDRTRRRRRDGSLHARTEQREDAEQPQDQPQFQEPGDQGSGPKARSRDRGTEEEVRAPRQARQGGRQKAQGPRRVSIPGDLDAQSAELFWLELRRLAKRYGAEIDGRDDGADRVTRSRPAPARTASSSRGRA